jgi:hypothetical protein
MASSHPVIAHHNTSILGSTIINLCLHNTYHSHPSALNQINDSKLFVLQKTIASQVLYQST